MSRRLRWIVAGIGLCVTSCIDQRRVNALCTWSDTARPLDLRSSNDRRHLIRDAQVAEALGIKHGDSFRARVGVPESRRIRERCTADLFGRISRDHGVTQRDIDQAAAHRDYWVDIVFAFVPVALMFAAATDRIARHFCRPGSPEDRRARMVGLALLAPVVSLIGIQVAVFWSWNIEWIRLGDGHLSYRAFRIPAAHHGWIAFFTALAIYTIVAVRRVVTRTAPDPLAQRVDRFVSGWRR